MAGLPEETEVENDYSDENQENQEIESAETEDPYKNESAGETAKRVYEELQRDGEADEEEKHGTQALQNTPQKTIGKRKSTGTEDFDPELSPPERLKVHEKEMFNNLPKGLKRAYSRSLKDMEGLTGRTQNEAARQAAKYREIEEVVSPLVVEWGELGLSPSQGMRELVSAQKRLTDPKLEVREKAFRKMAAGCGMQHILSASNNSNGGAQDAASDISNNPVIKRLEHENLLLRQKLDPIISNHHQALSRQARDGANANIASMEAVRDEVDARTGKYLRPELHDDAFIDRAGSLVSELMKTVPGRTAGEALRLAHLAITSGNLYAANQTKPFANNNSSINQRATQAAVSVRGKSAPVISTDELGEIPESALKTPTDTARWVAQRLSRGY